MVVVYIHGHLAGNLLLHLRLHRFCHRLRCSGLHLLLVAGLFPLRLTTWARPEVMLVAVWVPSRKGQQGNLPVQDLCPVLLLLQ